MNSYYQNLLKDVVSLFSNKEYEKADRLIDEELSMPYVPSEATEILEHYKDECRPYLSSSRGVTPEDIYQWSDGDERMKEKAVSALLSSNLRQYLPEVKKLLKADDLLDEFKGELIEALMDQKIDEELEVRKNGCSHLISFNPSKIVPAKDDPVLKETEKTLDDWLGSDNPFLENFCLELLKQETLEQRPDDFSGIDPKALAASLIRLVYEAMNDQEGYRKLAEEKGLDQLTLIPLRIEKRGEYCL